MSILHADNFSIYGGETQRMLEGVYAQIGPIEINDDPDGITAGKALRCMVGSNNTSVTDIRYVLQNGSVTAMGVAFRLWMNTLPVDLVATPMLAFARNAANDTMGFLRVTPTGAIAFMDPNDNLISVTPVPVLTAKGWYHIEVRWDVVAGAPAQLSAEVRVEGRVVMETPSIPASPTIAQTSFGNSNNFGGPTVLYWIKDFVVWDGAGSENNDFLGSVLVTTLLPSADVALNWTPFGGANGFSILDNSPPINAQYLFAEDLPLPSPYVAEMTNLPDEVTSVRALVSFVRAAKSDGGDGFLQTGIISSPGDGPVTAVGETRPITVAQSYWRDVFEVDPKTGARWLPAAVNAARLQLNRTA